MTKQIVYTRANADANPVDTSFEEGVEPAEISAHLWPDIASFISKKSAYVGSNTDQMVGKLGVRNGNAPRHIMLEQPKHYCIWRETAQHIGSFNIVKEGEKTFISAEITNVKLTDAQHNYPHHSVSIQGKRVKIDISETLFSSTPFFSWMASTLFGAQWHHVWHNGSYREFKINLLTLVAILSHTKQFDKTRLYEVFDKGIKAKLEVSLFDMFYLSSTAEFYGGRTLRQVYFNTWIKQKAKGWGRGLINVGLNYGLFFGISYAMGAYANPAMSWAIAYTVLKIINLFDSNQAAYGDDYSKTALLLGSFTGYVLAAPIAILASYGFGLLTGAILGQAALLAEWYPVVDATVVFFAYTAVTSIIEPLLYEFWEPMAVAVTEKIEATQCYQDLVATFEKNCGWATKCCQ